MSRINRRRFLAAVAASTALAYARDSWASAATPSLTIHAEKILRRVPADFTGLSYESSQLSHTGFFHPANQMLSSLMKTLGKEGVLRIGGNMSEFTVWSPDGNEVLDPGSSETEGPDPGPAASRAEHSYAITPQAIENLNGFLKETNWKLIYGLNLARGTPESAAAEASYVAKACGSRLLALQLGNEPDLFRHNGNQKSSWSYTEFIDRWKLFENAIHDAVPNAPLAGPDTSYNINWLDGFAKDAGSKTRLLTSHYYAEGPPTDPRMTIDYLLSQQKVFRNEVLGAMNVANKAGLPYRLSEGNSCYNAGKKGVSDTFAAALWAGDLLGQLAALGATGLNLHGGGNGLYTPIAGSQKDGYSVRPIYYGMLMARSLAGARVVASELETGGANVTAYAAIKDKVLTAYLFNKSEQNISLSIRAGNRHRTASIIRLLAPSIDATGGVTLGGSAVLADGSWQPTHVEPFRAFAHSFNISLPAYSAAQLTFA